jgi:hypothetical protein
LICFNSGEEGRKQSLLPLKRVDFGDSIGASESVGFGDSIGLTDDVGIGDSIGVSESVGFGDSIGLCDNEALAVLPLQRPVLM